MSPKSVPNLILCVNPSELGSNITGQEGECKYIDIVLCVKQ